MLFEKLNYKYNDSLFIDYTLNNLKKQEIEYFTKLNGENIFNLNGFHGKFETNNIKKMENENDENINDKNDKNDSNDNNDNIDDFDNNKCQILQYIINKVNHYRISNKMKEILKSISNKYKFLKIKWNQLNVESIVNVIIEKNDKLLLNIKLNGMKIDLIKYNLNCSKLIHCVSLKQLEKCITSIINNNSV